MKLEYLLDGELTLDFLGRAINDFQTKQLPRLIRLGNYYAGRQKIMKRQPTDPGKPNNQVMINYCNAIVNNYQGYLTGIPINYSNEDFEDVIDIIKYNDPGAEDAEYLKNALIYGRAFEINYIDEEGKQRFKLFNTKECLPIYSNTLNKELLYVVRFYKENLIDKDSYVVEVYGPQSTTIYKSAPGFLSFNFVEERPHFFNQCPVTVFSLNEDEESIFEQIITLQDVYNQMFSSGADDVQA